MMFRIARAGLHYFEEPCISGDSGSGTIFFCGCDLRCRFCQNYEISRGKSGLNVTAEELLLLMQYLEDEGANNINLVTPSKWTNLLIPVLEQAKSKLKVPIVWNSSGHEDVDDIRRLQGLVDIYMPDFKYSDNKLGREYSCVDGYFEKAYAAICEMRRQQPEDVIQDGLMKRGVVLRHLVLPSAFENTLGVLKAVYSIDPDMCVSLMGQYFPTPEVENDPVLSRRLTEEEYDRAVDAFFDVGLKNGYSQSIDSAIEDYVPSFDVQPLKDLLAKLKNK